MPYCSGCGSCYQEGDQVCKSCGCLLDGGDKLPDVTKEIRPSKKKAKNRGKKKGAHSRATVIPPPKEPEKETRAESENEQVRPCPEELTAERRLQSEVINFTDEIHLGKGIIKPKAVERDLEGYHFKYEEPSRATQKEELLFKEQGAELHAINPEFAVKGNARSNFPSSDSETLKVTGNAYSYQAEVKPASGTQETQEAQDTLETPESETTDFTGRLPEAELRDLETGWTEMRQSETDLLFEMETAAKLMEKNVKQTEHFDWEEVQGDSDGAIMDENVAMTDIPAIMADNIQAEVAEPAKVGETAPDSAAEKVPVAKDVLLEPVAPLRDNLPILMQGQQSWYGIPLPYQYQLSERFLVCVEPNGRLFEYDLTTLKKVTVKQSWLSKFLGIGDVTLDFQHQAPSRYILSGIANPAKLRTLLQEIRGRFLN
jgi:hypothetical protein